MRELITKVSSSEAMSLKLRSQEQSSFSYYTAKALKKYDSYWSIIGIRHFNEDPLLVAIRLMYIDEELLVDADFQAERDASNFLFLHYSEMTHIVAFLEDILKKEILISPPRQLQYFSPMSKEDLKEIHISSDIINQQGRCYYWYHYYSEEQSRGRLQIVKVPNWSQGSSGIGLLIFYNFEREKLRDSQFNPFDEVGSGLLTFNQQALEELIFLLKQSHQRNI